MASEEFLHHLEYLLTIDWRQYEMRGPQSRSIFEKFGLLTPAKLCSKTGSHETPHTTQEHLLVSGIWIKVERVVVAAEQVFPSCLMDHVNITTIINNDEAPA
jgi:hypothetical protein